MNLRTIANTSDEFTNKSSYSCRFWTKDSLFQNVRPLFLFFLSLLILTVVVEELNQRGNEGALQYTLIHHNC